MKICKYGCGKMKEGGKVAAVKKMKVGGTKSNPCFPKCSDGNGKCVPCPSTRIGDALIKTGLAAIGKYVAKTVSKNKKSKKTEAAQETVQEKRRGGMTRMQSGGYAKPQMGGDNVKMGVYGIPNAGTTGPNRTAGYQYKKGGTSKAKFGASVPVKVSCKQGMVRSADGKCVMSRPKFQKGGFPDLNKDGKITKADILKGRGVIKKMGGAKKK